MQSGEVTHNIVAGNPNLRRACAAGVTTIFGIPGSGNASVRTVADLPEESRVVLEAYSAGVNARIRRIRGP